ncbi:MAG: glycoside hydrolase N-terminal domain-containing protein [Candidatus Hydrogenedentota bacterium]
MNRAQCYRDRLLLSVPQTEGQSFCLRLLVLAALLCTQAAADMNALPGAEHNLRYETPAHRWDEAFPLGNGLLGALVWDDGTPLTISLDRTDLWDLRPVPEFHEPEYDWATMQAWEAAERYDDLQTLYEAPYHRPGPTKIPAGRLQLDIGKGLTYAYGALDLATATTHVRFEEGADATVYIHATEPVGIVQVAGAEQVHPRIVAPAFGGKEPGEPKPAISPGELSELGYPPPERSEGGNWAAYTQQGWGGFQFAVYAAWREDSEREVLRPPLRTVPVRSGYPAYEQACTLERAQLHSGSSGPASSLR